jgi:hypothetical protein
MDDAPSQEPHDTIPAPELPDEEEELSPESDGGPRVPLIVVGYRGED